MSIDLFKYRLEKLLGNALVKVILGQRRSGKSRFMRMIISHLITCWQVPKENILYINRELQAFDFIQDEQDFMSVFQRYLSIKHPTGPKRG